MPPLRVLVRRRKRWADRGAMAYWASLKRTRTTLFSNSMTSQGTGEIYKASLEALKSLPWTRIHVFPYSERKGTPATRFSDEVAASIDKGERKRRSREIHALSFERLERHYQQSLTRLKESGEPLKEILWEGRCRGPDGTRNWLGGYTPDYLRVVAPVEAFSDPESQSNTLGAASPQSLVRDPSAGEVAFWVEPVKNINH